MIALLASMLRARRIQALTVLLLSTVATAAAVAGPVALRTVDQAVVRNEVQQARTAERTITVTGFSNPSDAQRSGAFDGIVDLMLLPGFDKIQGGELEAFGPVASADEISLTTTDRVVFRDRVCEHLLIVSGRCVASTLELVIGEAASKRTGLRPGDRATIQAARYDPIVGLQPDGAPASLTIVGTYRPRDPTEDYWGAQAYFPVKGDGSMAEPMFLTRQTFDLIEHTLGYNSADMLAPAGLFTIEGLGDLKAQIERVTDPRDETAPDVLVTTDIPELVDRIQRSRDLAAQLLPVAFIPLVALCWFVVFLAVSYGLVARRHEIGLVNLRGTSAARRWWLAVAESCVAIIAGAPIGFVLGHVVVAAVASVGLGGTAGSELSLDPLPWALVAVVGALVVSILGQRRAIAEPVIDLLRGVPKRVAAWQSIVVEVFVIALALLGVLQLRATETGLSGVVLLVPGLVVVAVAMLVARLFGPAVGAVASFALRTGRLGSGLAAIQIARRPGSQRLFALLAVALGLLTFVAVGTGVAAEGRDERAAVIVGAPVVLTAEKTGINKLLHATHRADPEGLWAMAVLPIDQRNSDAPPLLAIDSARLATVASWRTEYGAGVAQITDVLRPPSARPMILHGEGFTVDIDRDQEDEDSPPLELAVVFEGLRDGSDVVATLDIYGGRQTYLGQAIGCATGCRLAGLNLVGFRNQTVAVNIHSIRGVNPVEDVVTSADLGSRARWRGTPHTVVAPFNGSLRVRSEPSAFSAEGATVSVVDGPLPMPGVSTQASVPSVTAATGIPIDLRVAATLSMLPRLGSSGTFIDLEYLQRVDLPTSSRVAGEIWLGPQAPADAIDRLRAAGLLVRQSDSIQQARSDLERSGPALALRFHLAAAALGVLLALGGLGLVAAVDRRRRADDLRALRLQGLPRRFVRRAALWGYLWLVVGAACAGLVAGATSWYATGMKLPMFTDRLAHLPPPQWPAPSVVLMPWLLATAIMIVAAVAAAWILRATVRSLVRKG